MMSRSSSSSCTPSTPNSRSRSPTFKPEENVLKNSSLYAGVFSNAAGTIIPRKPSSEADVKAASMSTALRFVPRLNKSNTHRSAPFYSKTHQITSNVPAPMKPDMPKVDRAVPMALSSYEHKKDVDLAQMAEEDLGESITCAPYHGPTQDHEHIHSMAALHGKKTVRLHFFLTYLQGTSRSVFAENC